MLDSGPGLKDLEVYRAPSERTSTTDDHVPAAAEEARLPEPAPAWLTHPRAGILASLAFVGALGWFGWRIGTPSPWRDEAVSYNVASRSVGQILQTTRHVDLVHLSYYLVAHLLHTLGAGLTSLRLVSAVAFAGSVAVTVLIGRELGATWHGMLAATLMVLTPAATTYAQQARPYAGTTFLATCATWVLVRVLDSRRRRDWAAYGVALVLCGLSNAISLTIVLSHAYLSLIIGRRSRRPWLVTAGTSLGVLSLFLALAFRQRAQVSWITRPGLQQLASVLAVEWPLRPAVIAIGLTAILTGLVTAERRLLAGFYLSWGFLPTIVLWVLSQKQPLFDGRYLIFCLPGAALAVAAGLSWVATRLRPRAGMSLLVAVVLMLGYFAWPDQMRVRAPSGVEDLRGVATVLARNARAGDPVVFLPSDFRLAMMMYPEATSPLRDLTLDTPAAISGTLVGTDRSPTAVRRDLLRERELWLVTREGHVVGNPLEQAEHAVITTCFREEQTWVLTGFLVERLRSVGPPTHTASGVACP